MEKTNIAHRNNENGFSLIEIMIALIPATFGLLAAGQLLYVALSTASLARSKETASFVAMDTLESLSDLYFRDRSHENLAPGNHGPQVIEVTNPNTGSVLNRFRITWTVENIHDPRPGKTPDARRVLVTVIPMGSGNKINNRPPFNKALRISTIFSPRIL